jgi:HEPN domain-containing protein
MRRSGSSRPDDPREWLRRARSNLALARARSADVYLEDLCFEAQQAAEKAVKAVLIHRGVEVPRAHDLARLLSLAQEAGGDVPDEVREAAELTPYAVAGRYPGPLRPVTDEEYARALALAERVVRWVERAIAGGEEA